MEQTTDFYMVYVEGEHTPTFVHAHEDDAIKEAKRLAEKTEKTAYVLKAIKSIKLAKFIVDDLEGLPF